MIVINQSYDDIVKPDVRSSPVSAVLRDIDITESS